ncbi:MAG: lysozyme inhibitor LprI family protein [Marinobacter sp.]|nr:lysozyme inhibitor LprI family protein [Marinobacter sp.]
MVFKKLQAAISPTLYIQIWEHRLKVTNLKTGQVYEDAPLVAIETSPRGDKKVAAIGAAAGQLPLRSNIELVNPFSHARTLLNDFVIAETLIMHGVRNVCGKDLVPAAPAVIMHPMEKLDGGLTHIERKALRELALGAGARAVTVYQGEELSTRTLDFDALAKRDPDTRLSSKRQGQSPALVVIMVVIGIALFILSLLADAKDELNCEQAISTLEINHCAALELQAIEETLAHYLDVSRDRLDYDPVAVASLDAAQEAWVDYRSAHCDAVYDLWRDGTIRTVMAIECAKALTQDRTQILWQAYLTYMDSTPPVLPEPYPK